VSFTQWIIAERLAAARQELAATPLGAVMVSTVARRWGFADPRHFARRFREAYGTSPVEWRRTLQRSG
jgi:AraC-like DNA-binding protein